MRPLLLPCTHAAMQVLKRLHAAADKRERKDALKPHGRLLAKIGAGNPLPLLEVMVQMVGAWGCMGVHGACVRGDCAFNNAWRVARERLASLVVYSCGQQLTACAAS